MMLRYPAYILEMNDPRLNEIIEQLETAQKYINLAIETGETLRVEQETEGIEEFQTLYAEIELFLESGGEGLQYHAAVNKFIRDLRRFIARNLNESLVRMSLELILKLTDNDPTILINIIRVQQFTLAASIARLMLRELNFPGLTYDPYAEVIDNIKNAPNYTEAINGAYNILEIGIIDSEVSDDIQRHGAGEAPSKSFRILSDLCNEELPEHVIIGLLSVILKETSPDHAVIILGSCLENLQRFTTKLSSYDLSKLILESSIRLHVLAIGVIGLLKIISILSPDSDINTQVEAGIIDAILNFDPASAEYESNPEMSLSNNDYNVFNTAYLYCKNLRAQENL